MTLNVKDARNRRRRGGAAKAARVQIEWDGAGPLLPPVRSLGEHQTAARHALRRLEALNGGVLQTSVPGRRQQPVVYLARSTVPEEYDVEPVIERKTAGGTGMAFGFIMEAGKPRRCSIPTVAIRRAGIDDVDSKNLRDGNPTNGPAPAHVGPKAVHRVLPRRLRVFVEAEK
jgi:hypothetical protein